MKESNYVPSDAEMHLAEGHLSEKERKESRLREASRAWYEKIYRSINQEVIDRKPPGEEELGKHFEERWSEYEKDRLKNKTLLTQEVAEHGEVLQKVFPFLLRGHQWNIGRVQHTAVEEPKKLLKDYDDSLEGLDFDELLMIRNYMIFKRQYPFEQFAIDGEEAVTQAALATEIPSQANDFSDRTKYFSLLSVKNEFMNDIDHQIYKSFRPVDTGMKESEFLLRHFIMKPEDFLKNKTYEERVREEYGHTEPFTALKNEYGRYFAPDAAQEQNIARSDEATLAKQLHSSDNHEPYARNYRYLKQQDPDGLIDLHDILEEKKSLTLDAAKTPRWQPSRCSKAQKRMLVLIGIILPTRSIVLVKSMTLGASRFRRTCWFFFHRNLRIPQTLSLTALMKRSWTNQNRESRNILMPWRCRFNAWQESIMPFLALIHLRSFIA